MCVFFPIVGWPAGLFWLALIPIGVLVWILRTQTRVSPAGLDLRSVFSSRHIDWAQVKGLSIPKRGFVRAHLDDDSEVPLPAVSYDRLRDLVDASGGRIPDPFVLPDPAPAAEPPPTTTPHPMTPYTVPATRRPLPEPAVPRPPTRHPPTRRTTTRRTTTRRTTTRRPPPEPAVPRPPTRRPPPRHPTTRHRLPRVPARRRLIPRRMRRRPPTRHRAMRSPAGPHPAVPARHAPAPATPPPLPGLPIPAPGPLPNGSSLENRRSHPTAVPALGDTALSQLSAPRPDRGHSCHRFVPEQPPSAAMPPAPAPCGGPPV
ncbi:PH domain-containing protein [Nocardia testacea]|uniref:PH domain-containing protein n=1 Tax=Nocardia testacea TaxID=248551 RepID=UPI0009FC652B|nr:PH domain-containing protein [Nocardia testacea]